MTCHITNSDSKFGGAKRVLSLVAWFCNFTVYFYQSVWNNNLWMYKSLLSCLWNIWMIPPGSELITWVQCGKQLCGVSGVYKFRSGWLSQQGWITQFKPIAGTHHYSGRGAHKTTGNKKITSKNVSSSNGA